MPIKSFQNYHHFSLQKRNFDRTYNDKPHKFDGVKYGGYYELNEIEDVIRYVAIGA